MVSRPRCLGCWRLFSLLGGFQTLHFSSFSSPRESSSQFQSQENVSNAIIIAPWWQTAHWCPQFLQLLVQRPVLLPQWDSPLTLPQEDTLHPLEDVEMWNVFVIAWRSDGFLRGQPTAWSSPWDQEEKRNTLQRGSAFVAGVRGNREILFKQF